MADVTVVGLDPGEAKLLKAVWRSMKRRCTVSTADGYARYGAKCVVVCPRWLASFGDFLADMGPRPSRLYSIERKENSLGYEPGNCRWATDAEQRRNRSDNRVLTFAGRSMVLEDWAPVVGILAGTIWERLRSGLSVERALFEPPGSAQRRVVVWRGERLHVGEWARRTGLKYQTICKRLDSGWSVEEALSKAVG